MTVLTSFTGSTSGPDAMDTLNKALSDIGEAAAQVAATQRPQGYRVWIEGDSIDAFNVDTATGNSTYYRDRGWFTALNILMGQRFQLAGISALPGSSTAEMRARYASGAITNYATFDIRVIGGGTNDGSASNPAVSKEQTVANKIAMAEQDLAAGKDVWLLLVAPRKSTSFSIDPVIGRNRAMWVNDKLKRWARTRNPSLVGGRLIVLDPWNAIIDPQSQTANPLDVAGSEILVDGLHPGGYGAFVLASAYKAVLDQYYPPINPRVASMADVYDATNNPSGNLLGTKGYFSGTGSLGSVATAAATAGNVTGGTASGWGPVKSSGNFVASELVMGKEIVPGYAGWRLNMAFAPVGKTASEVAYVVGAVIPTDGYAPGDTIEGIVGVEVSGLSNCYGIEAILQDDDGTTTYTAVANRYTANVNSLKYGDGTILLLRTPPLTIRPYSGTGTQRARLFLQLSVNATVSGSVTAKWFEPAIRKVA